MLCSDLLCNPKYKIEKESISAIRNDDNFNKYLDEKHFFRRKNPLNHFYDLFLSDSFSIFRDEEITFINRSGSCRRG